MRRSKTVGLTTLALAAALLSACDDDTPQGQAVAPSGAQGYVDAAACRTESKADCDAVQVTVPDDGGQMGGMVNVVYVPHPVYIGGGPFYYPWGYNHYVTVDLLPQFSFGGSTTTVRVTQATGRVASGGSFSSGHSSFGGGGSGGGHIVASSGGFGGSAHASAGG